MTIEDFMPYLNKQTTVKFKLDGHRGKVEGTLFAVDVKSDLVGIKFQDKKYWKCIYSYSENQKDAKNAVQIKK